MPLLHRTMVLWSFVAIFWRMSQITKFMGPIWDPPASCRPQMGPMLAPWTLLSEVLCVYLWMYACNIISTQFSAVRFKGLTFLIGTQLHRSFSWICRKRYWISKPFLKTVASLYFSELQFNLMRFKSHSLETKHHDYSPGNTNLELSSVHSFKPVRSQLIINGSGYETAAVLLPGFAIIW